MTGYIGARCPVCDKKFASGDDIVVCPVCGAPHHRDCYAKENKCAFEEEHITGKPWKSDHEEPPAPPIMGEACVNPSNGKTWGGNDANAKTCAFCGNKNPQDNLFCCSCGQRLLPNAQPNPQMNNPNFGAFINMDPTAAIYGGLSPEDKIGDFTAKEVATFVGRSSNYYVPRFKAEDEAKKAGVRRMDFSFSAFFFSFYYFFYRKMYKVGFLILLLSVVLSIPNGLLVKEVMPTVMNNIYSQMDLTEEELLELNGDVEPTDDAKARTLDIASKLASVVMVAIRAVFAIFASKLYYQHAMKKMAQVKAEVPPAGKPIPYSSGYEMRLRQAGDVNVLAVVLLAVTPMIITLVVTTIVALV